MESNKKSIQDILISEVDIFDKLSGIFTDAIVLKSNFEIHDASQAVLEMLNYELSEIKCTSLSLLFRHEFEVQGLRHDLEFKGYFTDFETQFKTQHGIDTSRFHFRGTIWACCPTTMA